MTEAAIRVEGGDLLLSVKARPGARADRIRGADAAGVLSAWSRDGGRFSRVRTSSIAAFHTPSPYVG